MRLFLNKKLSLVYIVDDGDYTQDEIDATETLFGRIAGAPRGVIELTEDQAEKHKSGNYEWIDGTQKMRKDLELSDE